LKRADELDVAEWSKAISRPLGKPGQFPQGGAVPGAPQ